MREHRSNARFNGAVAGALHARRASAKDIHSRIRIGVRSVPTIDATEGRLALAASFVDRPAFSAGLGRISGVDIFDAPATRLKLVFQHGREGGPALRQDRSVEATLASAAGRHVGDLELLQRHHAEPIGDIGRSFVQPVIARSRSVRVMLGDYQALASPASRSFLAPAQDALSALPLLGRRRNVRGHLVVLAGRKAEGVRYAAVNADAIIRSHCVTIDIIASARGVPSASHEPHGYGLDTFGHGSCEPQLHQAALRKMDQCPLPVEHGDGTIPTLNPEAIRMTPCAHGWIPAAHREEVLESVIEILQCAFAERSRHCLEPIHVGAKLRYLSALRCPRYAPAHCGTELSPVIATLFESKIVDESRSPSKLAKCLALLCRGINPVSISALRHAQMLLCSRRIRNRNTANQSTQGETK